MNFLNINRILLSSQNDFFKNRFTYVCVSLLNALLSSRSFAPTVFRWTNAKVNDMNSCQLFSKRICTVINWVYCSCFQRSFAYLLVLYRLWVDSRGLGKRRPDSRFRLSAARLNVKASRFWLCLHRVGARGSTVGECGRRVAWNNCVFVFPKTPS